MNPSKIGFEKLTQEEWEEIEVIGSNFEKKVCSCMLNLGSLNKNYFDDASLNVLGEFIYKDIFDPTIQKEFFKKKKKKENAKKQKTKNEKEKKGKNIKKGKNDIYSKFIENEKTKKLNELSSNCIKWEKEQLFMQKGLGFNSNILEIKLISFLRMGKILKNEKNVKSIIELIISIKKVLNTYSDYNGSKCFDETIKENVSETLIQLMNKYLEKLIKKNNFSIRSVFEISPKYICITQYDSFFDKVDIKPFESQIELISILKTNLKENKSSLLFYKALVGSGKTSVCLALSSLLLSYKSEVNSNWAVIFCCGISQVRIQIGQMAFNSLEFENKLTFGIASTFTNQSKKFSKVINHFSCVKEKNPILIISDMKTTKRLLREKARNYILFLDEPLIDVDQKNSPMTEKFIKIIQYAPSLTIISSATLPDPNEIPSLIKLFQKNHPNAEICTIQSDKAKISQQIYVDFYKKYYPHHNCKTHEELEKTIDTIKTNPFIARMYTGSSLFEMEEKLMKIQPDLFNKEDINSIEKYFNSADNLKQEKIQDYAIDLLESSLSLSQEELILFCNDEDNKDKYYENVSFENLATKSAHKLSGGCLIATENLMEISHKYFYPFLKSINLKEKITKYLNEKKIFEQECQKIELIKNDIERLENLDFYRKKNMPSFNFPNHLQINSKDHIKYYVESNNNFDIEFRKQENLINLLIEDLQEDINLMLLSGVAIFDERNINNENYNRLIRKLAKNKKLSYLLSNHDILYGANYPLNNVIITDDINENYNLSTIFQIMGRAGRIGKSWKSNCFITDSIKQKISNLTKKKNDSKYNFSEDAQKIEDLIEKKIGVKQKTEPEIKQKIIHIFFHKSCLDGLFALIPCFLYYCSKIKLKYSNKNISEINDFNIFQYIHLYPTHRISDLSNNIQKKDICIFLDILPEEIEILIKKPKKTFVIDHHISNLQVLEDLKLKFSNDVYKYIFDNNKSASILSYEYYFKKTHKYQIQDINLLFPQYITKLLPNIFDIDNFEKILKHVNDHDLTNGKYYPQTRILSSALYDSMYYNFKLGEYSLKYFWAILNLKYNELLKNGEILYRSIHSKILFCLENFLKTIKLPNVEKRFSLVYLMEFLPFSLVKYRSNIASTLFENNPDKLNLPKIIVFSTKRGQNEKIELSFRSAEEDFSSANFCEKYNGGGHKNAAGCEILLNTYKNWAK